MAEGSRPAASEPYPPKGAEPTPPPPPASAHSSSPGGGTTPETHHRPEGPAAHAARQGDPKGDSTTSTAPFQDRRDSATPSTRPPPSRTGVHSQGATAPERSGEQRLHPLLPEPPLLPPPQPPPAQRPRSVAEAPYIPQPPAASATPRRHADDRLRPAGLPVQRSHSDDSVVPAAPQPSPHAGDPPALPACQQPMQAWWHQDAAPYGGSYAHTPCHPGGAAEEETFSARGAPGTVPRPPPSAPLGGAQGTVPRPPPAAPLGLMSSVSETGLDAKRLLHCCDHHDCSWVSSLPPGVGPWSLQQQQQQHQRFGLNEVYTMGGVGPGGGASPGGVPGATRDVGTMTAHRRMVDSGVQTEHSPPPHVFPQVCLVEENGNETDGNHNKMADSGGNGSNGQKSPVKEVKWDAEGMTWEVYGASVDPEELGLAIQKHLELQIKETAGRAAKLCRKDTNTSRQSVPPADSRRRKRSRMTIGSIRTPACCARSSTAVD